jgi:tripartite-type tricarboxylate transporter receptor subunit TctC
MARIVSDRLGQVLGQSVVIENKGGGAGGSVGAKFVASSDPDGYTILITPGGSLTNGPAVHRNIGYDPVKAFTPVAYVAGSHWVTVAPVTLPARNMVEFIAYARANPGKLNFGFGQGTAPQLVGEWLKNTQRLDIASVPYRGGMQAITDMMGGNIHLNIGTASTLVPLIREGKIRAISVWGPTRFPELPEVPTMIESGFPDLTLFFWSGLWAPTGTPQPVIEKLNAETNAALRSPEMMASMKRLGIETRIGSPADFAAFIASETPKWADIVAKSGVKVME